MTEYSYASISHAVMKFAQNAPDNMERLIFLPYAPEQGGILDIYFLVAAASLVAVAWLIHFLVKTSQVVRFSYLFFGLGILGFFAMATLQETYPVQHLFPFGFGIGNGNRYGHLDNLMDDFYRFNAEGLGIIFVIPFILVALPPLFYYLVTTGDVPDDFTRTPVQEQVFFGLGIALCLIALVFFFRGRRTRSFILGIFSAMALCQIIMPGLNILLIMGLKILGPMIALLLLGMGGAVFAPRRRS